jgi:hypothetical protein
MSDFGYSEGPDYGLFSSFEELIVYETTQISELSSSSYEDLADAYMNRGESYLLSDHYELALEDFQNGHESAGLCSSKTKSTLLLRSLFGMLFSYGMMGKMNELYFIEGEIRKIFNNFDCKRVGKKSDLSRSRLHLEHSLAAKDSEKPILGPDRISIDDCIDRAQKTAKASRILILKAPLSVQTILNILIDDLQDRAIYCCLSGGIWKACLRPILNKWQLWNEKWKTFGIPPDPAWD